MPSRFGSLTALFYFFYFWATGVFIIFVPKTLVDIGYSATQIGILLSLMPLIRFVTPFLFSAKLKFTKTTFLFSLALSTLFFAAFVFTYDNFWLLFINTLLYGFFVSITLPYVDTVALKAIPKEKYGLVRLFGSIGFMGAGLALGKMALGKEAVFLHYLISVALMSIFGAVLAYEARAKEEKEEAGRGCNETRRYTKDYLFWIAMIFMQLSFGAFYGFFTVFESEHGISMENITYLWSIGVIAEIFMFAFQGKLLANIKPLFIIKLSIASVIVRWLLLHFFAGNFIVAAFAQITHALNFALFTTAAFLFIFSRYKDKKKAQMHFYGFSYGLGGFFGSFLSGALYGQNIFLYSALFAAISMTAIMFFRPSE
jgi:PPP family 3-phenylpropionic acid transporter